MKIKRNILFLASWFPSDKSLFDGDFIERHAKSVALIHHVTVIYVVSLDGISEIKKEEEQIDDLKIIRIYFPNKSKIQNQWTKFKLYLKEINSYPKFDLIHVNVTYPVGLVALYLKLVKKIPYVITEHWTGFLPQDPAHIPFVKLFLMKKIVDNSSYLLPVSDNLGNAMRNLGLIQRTKTIRNVIDFDIFNSKENTENKIPKFLHISNLTFQKNCDGILNVAERLWKNKYIFELHIGGNGDLSTFYSYKMSSDFTDKLILFGALSQEEVAVKMNEANIFILFSRFENQPCVQIESFACGLPVLASDVGGINEVFPVGFGQIITSENEEELYQSLKNILENKVHFKSKNEIQLFAKENFSMQKIANDFHEIYKQILK